MCAIIIGEPGTLFIALKHLAKYGIEIHKALKVSFIKLFAYARDAIGIRYAGDIGGQNATFEEAEFLLVSCSAFIIILKQLPF